MTRVRSNHVTLVGSQLAESISRSGLSIYDPVPEHLFYDIATLEARLSEGLRGAVWAMPIRTRSKIAKAAVCRILGYPMPGSFVKTQPRFPGQNLDVFVQKSNNLQIWNEDVDPERRYALIRVDNRDVVSGVRVLTGEAIALLDTTGTLTTKYQAARLPTHEGSCLVSVSDTQNLINCLAPREHVDPAALAAQAPTDRPVAGTVLTIKAVFGHLEQLLGHTFTDPGVVNERGRGVVLQRLVCERLGLNAYADAGQFPDILSQVLEVKLQLSPTIDLGLVAPDSDHIAQEAGGEIRHCDVRYAVFYGHRQGDDEVRLTDVVIATGESFFTEFRRFEGLIQNAKLQIPLPAHVFDSERLPD